MNKIYSNGDNHHVKATIVYANEENMLFRDELFEKSFTTADIEELKELFFSGLFVNFNYGGINSTEQVVGLRFVPDGPFVMVSHTGEFGLMEAPVEE